jgi:hypothetical protein
MMICAIALILLLDVSQSVYHDQFLEINEAHASAFESSLVVDAIEKSGGAAIRVVHYSNFTQPMSEWRIVRNRQDSISFASEIRSIRRNQFGFTATGTAINDSIDLLEDAPCGDEKVIDIVTDGTENVGTPTIEARDRAENLSITINALAIETWHGNPVEWVSQNLITSYGFYVSANYQNLDGMLRRKLVMEISSNFN